MTPITNGATKLAEFARDMHVCVTPHDTPFEDALKPEFWVHVAFKFKAWDRIELRANDDSWWAELVVRKASRSGLVVAVISHLSFDEQVSRETQEPTVPPGYVVNFGGPVHKYRVLRAADNTLLAHGLSKREAEEWARNDAKAMA